MLLKTLIQRYYPFLFLMILLFAMLYRNRNAEKRLRRSFIYLLFTAILLFLLDFAAVYAGSIPNNPKWCKLISTVKYIVKPAMLYQVLMISERRRKRRERMLLSIPLTLETVMLAVSYPFGWIFSFSWTRNENMFIDGPLKGVTWIVLILYMAMIVASAFGSGHSRSESFFLLLGISFIVINMAVELLVSYSVPGMELTVIALSILVYCMYFSFHYDAERLMEKEKELNKARTHAMISQIKPHFIYNTLACIAEVCHEGSPEGEEAIITFSQYLRECLHSLNDSGMVSFGDELRTIQHYIELEKLQTPDKIHVIYNIRERMFRIPVLSVETLVENAVKHGLRKKTGSGTITIETGRNANGIFIIIKDDGVGFDPSRLSADNTHIGLKNSQLRLKMQCGASMNIISSPGSGTEIRIVMPAAQQ